MPSGKPLLPSAARVATAALLAAGLVAAAAQEIWPGRAASAEHDLRNEYEAIGQMPGSTIHGPVGSRHKGGHALLSADYMADANYLSIRRFYDAELAHRGWTFCGERKMGPGKEVVVRYSKGEYVAEIDYVASQPPDDWTYSLSLSWHLFAACAEI